MASDCLVQGTNTWDNGAANGTEVVAGVVHAGTRAATLVEMVTRTVNGTGPVLTVRVNGWFVRRRAHGTRNPRGSTNI